MAIAEDQKDFVHIKVRSLGTMIKVEELYKTDSNVDVYARALAQKLFVPKGERLRRRTTEIVC